MSIDLHVDATGPLRLAVLREGLDACLHELLDVKNIPPLAFEELENGARSPAAPGVVLGSERSWVIGVDGCAEYAFVNWVEVDDLSTPLGVHRFVGITGGGLRTPLEFALMAAAA